MTWFKVDDGFHRHRKVKRIQRSLRLQAVGAWTAGGSYAADELTDGLLEAWELEELGVDRKSLDELIRVGLWHAAGDRCDHETCPAHDRPVPEGAIVYHDWFVYQPDAATVLAAQGSKSDGGRLGNHKRWHVDRGLVVPGCEFCNEVAPPGIAPPIGVAIGSASDHQSLPDGSTDGFTDRSTDGVSDRFRIGSASPDPGPVPDDDEPTTFLNDPHDPNVRANDDEDQSPASLELIAFAAEQRIQDLDGLIDLLTPAFDRRPSAVEALSIAKMLTVEASAPVAHPVRYVARSLKQTPDKVRRYAEIITRQHADVRAALDGQDLPAAEAVG